MTATTMVSRSSKVSGGEEAGAVLRAKSLPDRILRGTASILTSTGKSVVLCRLMFGRFWVVEQMSVAARDKLIVRYWREGYSARAIGVAVGLSERGVRHALDRIAEGRPGRPMR
ncbi:hypothetical protein JCM12141A_46950 [Mycolicibacterium hodleri]